MFYSEENEMLSSAALIQTAATHLTVETSLNSFYKNDGALPPYIPTGTVMPALVGDVAIDTQAIRVFGVRPNKTTGVNEYIATKSNNFSKHDHFLISNIPVLDTTYTTIGFLYVKNESVGNFIGGTTLLNVGGLTVFCGNSFWVTGY